MILFSQRNINIGFGMGMTLVFLPTPIIKHGIYIILQASFWVTIGINNLQSRKRREKKNLGSILRT